MRDFFIDAEAEKIHFHKTRQYFDEVIKVYYAESYRAAMVMLYSVTIADLLYKLEELKDLYDDESAKNILEKVKEAQSNVKNLAEWEGTLIDLINQHSDLISPAEYAYITGLRQIRHLCAHPVMTEHYELYQPNKETVRAYLRNILEGVLTKPAILSKKIFNKLIEDVADKKLLLTDDRKLEVFLEDRYFKRFSNKVKESIFRSLWIIVLKDQTVKSEENRPVLFRTLLYMLRKDYALFKPCLEREKDYYSKIHDNQMLWAAMIFNRYPALYQHLSDGFRALMEAEVARDANYFTYAAFLSPTLAEHVVKVIQVDNLWNSPYERGYISQEAFLELLNLFKVAGTTPDGYDFLISIFGQSNQFDQADNRFNELIAPFLHDFSRDQMVKVLTHAANNTQIGNRRHASRTNRQVLQALFNKYNYEPENSLLKEIEY